MTQSQYAPVHPYPLPGEVLDGKYRIEHLLGEGGMGAVAKATHMLRRAPVALKFMSPAVLAMQGAVERFVNEGVAASQIDSDHVVKVFDVGRMPSGAPYLVMEYLDGCDLSQLLAREGGRLDPTRVVHFGLQILRALQTAHASGIIHRDMKPSNCFVIDKDGEPDFVKLVDFGISKVRSDDADGRSANLTRTNSALGTPLYMSPEQARSPRDVDHRADLYSVGAIIYELLAGRTPYTADSGEYTEILFKIFTTDPEPLRTFRPDVPEGLEAVVHRALSRDLAVRYGSSLEMAEALFPFADDRSAQIMTRLRGGRGRSVLPEPPLPAVSTHAPPVSGQDAATAATFPGQVDPGRGLKVPTEIGVTRETSAGPGAAGSKSGRGLVALVVAVIGLGIGGAAFVVLTQHRATPATTDPGTAATVVAPPRASVPETASAPPSASLAPLPTGSASAALSASALPGPGRPVPGVVVKPADPGAPPPHPTSLPGIGLH
jgi:eukaryotic-like serine/threonine-protein kinase